MKKKLRNFFIVALFATAIGSGFIKTENNVDIQLNNLLKISTANAETSSNILKCSWFGGTGCHSDNWGKNCGEGLINDPDCAN